MLDPRLKFWHIVNVNGETTNGVQPVVWDLYKLPPSTVGMRVLDIGARDGGYAFEAERRGSRWVTAADIGDPTNFLYLKTALESRDTSWRQMSVYDLPLDESYELVIALGLLYHLRHPLLALERLAAVTRGLCVLETHTDMHSETRPAMVFYPGAELGDDRTNWWGPNVPLLEAWFRDVGFKHELAHSTCGRLCYHLTK